MPFGVINRVGHVQDGVPAPPRNWKIFMGNKAAQCNVRKMWLLRRGLFQKRGIFLFFCQICKNGRYTYKVCGVRLYNIIC